jgi:hypothetical protein
MNDDYVKVTGWLCTVSQDAVLIMNDDFSGWIPQSLIHGGDLIKMKKAGNVRLVTFRLVAWKAEQLGL